MELRILAADDEKNMRDLYSRIFSSGRYELTLAESVAEATGLMSSGAYDLLISDLVLPDGDGLELVRRFREQGRGRVILITASMEDEDLAKLGEREGVLKAYGKPFSVRDLLQVVDGLSAP